MTKKTVEFGDFQTPLILAKEIVNLIQIIQKKCLNHQIIIEPSCGKGNFIRACIEAKLSYQKIIAWEINSDYIQYLKQTFSQEINHQNLEVKQQDFFLLDWDFIKHNLKNPILFIGNPPWVTNSQLGKLISNNLPLKNNFQSYNGLDALTGRSNFDISEWMLIKMLQFISGNDSAMAFLIKTSVARKLFLYINKYKLAISNISIYEIDTWKYFKVNVSACLFFAQGNKLNFTVKECPIYSSFLDTIPQQIIGVKNNSLVSNIEVYESLKNIDNGCEFQWRSGIKHDCSKVMELTLTKGGFKNGFNELIDIEEIYIYPLYKSSDIAKKNILSPNRYMLVTQKNINEDTFSISYYAPKTWHYLQKYSYLLNNRKSSIYKSAPQFAIFGVGEYSFKPFKIVISSLYKNLNFSKIGCYQEKPIILDDTCYMLSFDDEKKSDFILQLLNSSIAKSFLNSLIFSDNKRLITISLLNRISLSSIALYLGKEKEYDNYFNSIQNLQYSLF
ncbi:MAG: SAM-dependent methyltransferase [Cyanobacteria bacterium]|nr:SAM-dependent methyltransferase [Cyanobacteria bacterium CG_2015-16_32_12]NCO79460.1 SAM-dependent methyltransferase [Cyanobacteria bacterium CG_2015-22_32_23]NCQ41473.1 SAM-dependent methyltransferase [Cyanobacteria bacterium CG_2015-04_32_10]NCS84301.1 SAM-dependent methyltransferase [Cyanobacteria bacterium CG_2015-02_32_10]